MKKITNSTRFWQVATLFLLTFFVFNQTNPGFMHGGSSPDMSDFSVVSEVHASEVYPMFTCPCCGTPLNKEEPCCGAMTQMIDYVDTQVSDGKTKDEVVFSTAKEFGIDRLTNEEDKIALKQKLIDSAPIDAPKIELNETEQDLGKVSLSKGIVSTEFKILNEGKSDLVINKLSSSCGCTSASILYKGVEGPKFVMEGHGQENPKDWEVSIKSGDTATLKVHYDPSVHPGFKGDATRTVSIFSNDPVEFETRVTITLEQTK